MIFDVPYIQVTAVQDGDIEKTKQLTVQIGIVASSLEHGVLELLFAGTEEYPANAISAVKALQIAVSQGQKIYLINKTNVDQVLPLLNHDSIIMDEIRTSINVGKEVTTHESTVSVPGWSGAGYIIIDPRNGDGAYKITGGKNGGSSNEPGFIDFTQAVVGQPGLLIATCKAPFLEQTIKNIVDTNNLLPYTAVGKTLISFKSTSMVASSVGGMTIITGIKFAVKGFSLRWLATVVAISMLINSILLSMAFEIGVVIGSAISAATCRRK